MNKYLDWIFCYPTEENNNSDSIETTVYKENTSSTFLPLNVRENGCRKYLHSKKGNYHIYRYAYRNTITLYEEPDKKERNCWCYPRKLKKKKT